MPFAPEEEKTIACYDSIAEAWSAEHSNPGYWANELAIFKSLLPRGRILELGCGSGRDAQELIDLGYNYIGIDVSQSFIDIAKRRVPLGTFILKSFDELKGSGRSRFDGFWASAVFLHVPKNKIDEYFANLHECLKQDSIGFISLKEGSGESFVEEIEYTNENQQRFFAYYSEEEFREILSRNGFSIQHYHRVERSKRTIWLCFFVKKILNF